MNIICSLIQFFNCRNDTIALWCRWLRPLSSFERTHIENTRFFVSQWHEHCDLFLLFYIHNCCKELINFGNFDIVVVWNIWQTCFNPILSSFSKTSVYVFESAFKWRKPYSIHLNIFHLNYLTLFPIHSWLCIYL